MAHQLSDSSGGYRVRLSGATLTELFASATEAFGDAITPLDSIQPRQADELDVDAPDLDELLVDYLSELLYRFDARGWLTRHADLELHEKDGGWSLEGTLRGERRDAARHPLKGTITGVSYRDLHVHLEDGVWRADILLDLDSRE